MMHVAQDVFVGKPVGRLGGFCIRSDTTYIRTFPVLWDI